MGVSAALIGTHQEQILVAQSLAVGTHHVPNPSLREKTVVESRRSRQRERKDTPPPL
jgi:hypothetical protein